MMKHFTLIFLFLMALAAPFGFGSLDPNASPAARLLFYVFGALFLCSLVGWITGDAGDDSGPGSGSQARSRQPDRDSTDRDMR